MLHSATLFTFKAITTVIILASSAIAFSGGKHSRKTRTEINMSNDKFESQHTIGQMLGGLVFLKTNNREALADFYMNRIGMSIWLEQPNITILSHGNMILGFHQIPDDAQDTADLHGMYTFVYPSIEKVDKMHHRLRDIADGSPRYNERYKIYQFFARDPEGRKLEFQAFLHALTEVSSVNKVM